MLQRQPVVLRVLQPMIVKVQRPLAGSGWGARHPWLVYAHGHDRQRFFEPTPELEKAMAGAPKAYFDAEWAGDSWAIGRRVEDQDW